MADPIEANYTPDGDDWTVAVTGRGRTLTGRAPGLIAARDRADQLVEELAPQESGRKTVVHLLNGDAVEFTTAYLTARLARSDEPLPGATADTARPAEAANDASRAGEGPAGDEAGAKATTDETTKDADQPGGADSAGNDGAAAEAPPGGPVGVVNKATGARGPIGVVGAADKDKAKKGRAPRRPTPRPRTQSQTAQPAVQPAPAPAEETAPSGH